ncbi:hypothetical protein SADUNF_Sadunf18G0113800 [Salix dunnii]|uniref:Wall-associated receptor kinase galacturonan-binding domain-containing protein n=1 Tax=Salix dunnii TaxID=1413687 RepID=A0A835J911_9ROSI|nr:hypothetical protein SADUNF_Sadunf18G0113800 [Salix dunnii]
MGAVQLTVFHVILLFWSLRTAESQVMALTGCESNCGGIEIPYPFGMKEGCFLHERFKIHCNDSSEFPKLTVNGTDLAVSAISVSYSRIYVKFPMFFANCGGKDRNTVVDLEGSPLVFSPGRGINCCQTRIPSNLKVFNVTMKGLDDGNGSGGEKQCRYVFLADRIWNVYGGDSDPYHMKDVDSVRAVLYWGIDRWVFESLVNNGSYYNFSYTSTCKDMNPSINSTIVQCSCNPGFEGNPYLYGICQGKLRGTIPIL